jgi:hypothetical protein
LFGFATLVTGAVFTGCSGKAGVALALSFSAGARFCVFGFAPLGVAPFCFFSGITSSPYIDKVKLL